MNNIEENFEMLQKEYPKLHMNLLDNKYMIEGEVRIYAINEKIELMDDFHIIIEVPLDFPRVLPTIKETSNKIPKSFEHVNIDKTLCLGIDTEIKIKFMKKPTLLYWFQNFVVSYFYSVMYYNKYRKVPYGERKHGTLGIIQFYSEFLKLYNKKDIYAVLNAIKHNNINESSKCPCGSYKKIRKCHLNEINILKKLDITSDLMEIERLIKPKKKNFFLYPYTNKEYNKRFKMLIK